MAGDGSRVPPSGMEYNGPMEPSDRPGLTLLPRFQTVAPAVGFYESIYLKAVHPSEPTAFWIRYTIHKKPGDGPVGSVWSTFFDASLTSPATAKVTVADPRVVNDLFTMGDCSIGNGAASGAVLSHRWDLRFSGDGPELRHLPKTWMYDAPVPRTKLSSPFPIATFNGSFHVRDRELQVDGWRGMVGHNWGSQHAERWIWLHAIFDDASWLDVAVGRIRIARITTPWVANGAVCIGGVRHAVGGLRTIRGTKVVANVNECRFSLPGELPLAGKVTRRPEATVAWEYRD
ncbi:MAG: hypothetical protein QOH90_1626, partial [Actinomycetota bacterium]|nr:hypothetical protein [Actinomycetota bacterium]